MTLAAEWGTGEVFLTMLYFFFFFHLNPRQGHAGDTE